MKRGTRALALGLCLASMEAGAQLMLPVRATGAQTAVDATHPLGAPDCLNGTVNIQVSYTSPTVFNQLEFWIGSDAMTCSMTTSRTSTTAATCWQITSATIGGQQSTYSNSAFPISARRLIDPIGGDCTTPQTARGALATNYLSLLAVTSAGANMVGMALAIPYDLSPPDVATGVTAVPGEGSIQVSWDSRSTPATAADDAGTTTTSTTTATTDLAGFWLLCDPPTSASSDAGVTDGGADAGIDVPDQSFGGDAGTSTTCGEFPTIDLYSADSFNRYVRGGRTSASATTATATGLRDNTAYRCVVVAEDLAGNRSVSAPTACVVPVPVTDFWERYRQSGGVAQPINCAARPGARGPAALAGVALAVVAALARRRRRSS